MTVRELKAALELFDDDALVVMAEDEEGNGYSPLSYGDAGLYHASTTWSGELYYEDGRDEDAEDFCRPPADSVPCVCLWPVN